MVLRKCAARFFSGIFAAVLAVSVLCSGGAAWESQVQPRYVGVTSLSVSLNISRRGLADCYCDVWVSNGYTADLELALQRDGETIKTWSTSGTGELEIRKSYYVSSGHDYQLAVSVTVKNSSGKIVDTPSASSDIVYY